MGRVKIGNPKQSAKKEVVQNVHTGSPLESAFSKEKMEQIAENVMLRYKNAAEALVQSEKLDDSFDVTEPVVKELADKRARKYIKAVRKQSKKMDDFLLAKLVNLQKTNEELLEKQKLAEKFIKTQNADLVKLEKEHAGFTYHLELIEQEIKVKPVHIKETKTIERFDHRLLVINLVLIFLNIILLLK